MKKLLTKIAERFTKHNLASLTYHFSTDNSMQVYAAALRGVGDANGDPLTTLLLMALCRVLFYSSLNS